LACFKGDHAGQLASTQKSDCFFVNGHLVSIVTLSILRNKG